MGIIGSGRIAGRFIKESKFVSGINVEGIYNPHIESARKFAETYQLAFYTDKIDEWLIESIRSHFIHVLYVPWGLWLIQSCDFFLT